MDQVYIYNYQLLNNLNSETAMNLLTDSRLLSIFSIPVEDTSWNGAHRPVLGIFVPGRSLAQRAI